MEIRHIKSRGIIFTFYDLDMPTNVSVIVSERTYYIIDSYLGPDIMRGIDKYLIDNYGEKEYILINTHSDWDHIWGNCYFNNSPIIGHILCHEDIVTSGIEYLNSNSEYIRGNVSIRPPNIVFDSKIFYIEDSIEIVYTPGHSKDSISVIDRKDGVLYGGDNIERPIPYIQWNNIKSYMDTLEFYMKLDIDKVIGGHTLIEDKGIIVDNLDYLKSIYNNNKEIDDETLKERHASNLEFLNKNK